ncbi:hypothetical protein P389DRAFT_193695 [Cystobasidium minutum MCA 4210]|uniref:uncharacterized protein n=1 Tax=Cystobasidium minutum MCA 4210 TaxID=1397322 RepID=UPI0034CF492A|eukprot:jgi/Rhomi1/193695/gm1.1909_g
MASSCLVLPIELQQRIVQICIIDPLELRDVRSTRRALRYATISTALYQVVTREAYRGICLGDWTEVGLELEDAKKLARTLQANRQLSGHVRSLAISLGDESYSEAWNETLRTILGLVEPSAIRFDTNAPIEKLLCHVQLSKTKSLFLLFEGNINQEDEVCWMNLVSGASSSLEVLTVPGCMASSRSASHYQAIVPYCPNLRGIEAASDMLPFIPLSERQALSTDLYESLIVKHAKQIVNLEFTPFQFARNKKLSQVAMLPELAILTLHYLITREEGESESQGFIEEPWLYSTFEYEQVEDLKAFPSLQELYFDAYGHPVQHRRLMWALTRLLANPRWLPNLSKISIADFRVLYPPGRYESEPLEQAIESHMKAFDNLALVCEDRYVELDGSRVVIMSSQYGVDAIRATQLFKSR